MTDRFEGMEDMTDKEPYALWLPKASVRALLAFTLVGLTGYALLAQGIEIAAPLFALTGVVVERYFGKGDA